MPGVFFRFHRAEQLNLLHHDRTLQSCVKRGCGSLCPEGAFVLPLYNSLRLTDVLGALTSGRGSRYVPQIHNANCVHLMQDVKVYIG
jgi:hypothetical protein